MSIQKLTMLQEKPVGYTYSDKPVFPIGPSLYFQSKYSCNPPILSLSNGSQSNFTLQPSRDDVYCIHDIVLRWTTTNVSATETCKVYNPFALLSSVKMLINNVEVSYLRDQFEIMSAVSRWLKSNNESTIYNALAKIRNNTAKNFTADEFTASSTTYHQLPLFVIFPELEGIVVNLSGLQRLDFQFVFQSNANSPAINNLFCQSNTTSNAYDSDLTYSNIECEVKYTRHTDARAWKPLGNYLMNTRKYLTKQISNIAWNVVGTNNFTINLSNDWAKTNRIEQVSVFFYDVAGNSAYNSASACKFLSGAKYASFIVRSRSNVVLDLQQVVKDSHNRKEYEMQVYKNRNGVEEPLELLNETTDLGKFFIVDTLTIDLSNVIEDDQGPSEGLSGRSNDSNDIEIQFFCASAISANVNAYCVLHTSEISVLDSKGGVKKIQ